MRILVYSLLRVALLTGALVVLYLIGMRSWLLWLVAIVVAALLSYLLLPRQRDAAASEIASGVERRRNRESLATEAAHDAAVEDALVDASEPRDEHDEDKPPSNGTHDVDEKGTPPPRRT